MPGYAPVCCFCSPTFQFSATSIENWKIVNNIMFNINYARFVKGCPPHLRTRDATTALGSARLLMELSVIPNNKRPTTSDSSPGGITISSPPPTHAPNGLRPGMAT